MGAKTTLFIIDDDAEVRQILKDFFQTQPDYLVIGEASDGASGVEACRILKPNVVLADIQMPILDGISATRLLLEEGLAQCVIMLTAFEDREYIQRALDAGAFGYLTKPFVPERILPTMALCIAQSRAHHLLKKNFKRLREHSGERTVIDRTKLQLMERKGWTEGQAYRYIRELSRRKGMSLTKIASYLSVYLENHP